MVIGHTLLQFVFRLTCGMALALAITPPHWVASSFFRVQSWILLGVNTVGAVALWSQAVDGADYQLYSFPFIVTVILAVGSYLSSVIWLYEWTQLGRCGLWLLAGIAAVAGMVACLPHGDWSIANSVSLLTVRLYRMFDFCSSASLLGFLLTGMLLGHFYLNWPGMKLAPLERLINSLLVSAGIRCAVVGLGTLFFIVSGPQVASTTWMILLFRWIAGVIGPAVTGWMARVSLRVPNTQSATGILYAGTVSAFLGELLGQWLAQETLWLV